MVATTPVLLWTLSNLGPLTTTFTAAPSCATQRTAVFLATARGDESQPVPRYSLPELCGKVSPVGDCNPAGDKWDEINKNHDPGVYDAKTASRMYYQSPGLACPSGWATSAAVTRQDDGKYASATGVFVPLNASAVDRMFRQLMPMPHAHLLAMGLEPGETAAACCPSGKGWYLLDNLGCYSVLPTDTLKPTAGCFAEWAEPPAGGAEVLTTEIDYQGIVTATASIIVDTHSGAVKLATTTFAPTETYIAVTAAAAVLLVHREGDQADKTGGGGDDKAAGTTDTGKGGDAAKPTNAAAFARPDGAWGLGGLAALCVTAAMAGAAFVVPW